jgi:hypothetical protein
MEQWVSGGYAKKIEFTGKPSFLETEYEVFKIEYLDDQPIERVPLYLFSWLC